ncbi:MAG: hypothetical protein CL623_11875 [Arcobacter sp.]|nr:hypothetical protein [Arcobacter sp.]|tara:strand:- start:16398 stop:17777 length:1380 start_codon:yes stop_codon:yes gene_type:complete
MNKEINILSNLLEFVTEFKFENLGKDIINVVQMSFIDTLAVTLAGADEECSKILQKTYLKFKETEGIPILGTPFSSTPEIAALLNGTSSHALDLDDTGASTQGHPSAIIWSTIWAFMDEKTNDKDIISSYVIGVEVMSKLSRALPKLHLKGWHPSSVIGIVAATVSVSYLLKLNKDKMAYAIGLATSMSSGLVCNFGSMTKPFHIGKASSNAVQAVKLAQNNFTSSINILDDKNKSFLTSIFGKDEVNYTELIKPWKHPLAINKFGLNFKRYPCCALTHRSLDIMLELLSLNNIDTSLIEKVICRVPPRATKVLFYKYPNKGLEGKFCMPFVLSCALKFKKVTPSMFTDNLVVDKELLSLISLIDFDEHEDWIDGENDWRPDIVKIILKDKSVYQGECVYPKGHAKRPMDLENLSLKFIDLSKNILSKDKQTKILDLVIKLGTNDNTYSEIMSILRSCK